MGGLANIVAFIASIVAIVTGNIWYFIALLLCTAFMSPERKGSLIDVFSVIVGIGAIFNGDIAWGIVFIALVIIVK
ncbi:hypothetical protein Deiofobo_0359 [Pseudomonas phage Deifobo]|nr:hypothetical protein Deiofobo_0359 [Pseudomonas phage Deifobo]